MKPTLYPHQETALSKMFNGCILGGDVGSGKSLTAVAYYMKHEAPRPVYVFTTALKRDALDWEKEFLHYNVSTAEGGAGGILKVDSWNNISKYEHIRGALLILDEQRLVGAGAWVKSFLKLAPHNRWIILSATPGDNWLDYIPVFLAHGFYKNRTEFKLKHVVYSAYSKFPKVDHYVSEGRLIKLRKALLVEMPYDRHTVRHSETVPVEYDAEVLARVLKERWNVFEDKPIKAIPELFSVVRKVVYSNSTRLDAVRELMEKHDRLIVFYNFNYELESLRNLAGDIEVAEWNGHKHEPVPEGEKWIYLVQYTAGSEGWNCVSTDAMVFHSLTYSYKQWHQAHGRIDRLNTPYTDLHYYTLMSKAPIDLAVKRALNEKHDFNESRFAGRK